MWRNETGPLFAELPSRYAQVLDSILMRLESSALSVKRAALFSRAELIDNLALWLDKAEGYVSGLRRQGEQKPWIGAARRRCGARFPTIGGRGNSCSASRPAWQNHSVVSLRLIFDS